jgi:hypothetical protein
MTLRYILLYSFLLGALPLFSQITIKGKVVDKETNMPIDNVSVYISNSSSGTRTDAAGNFILTTRATGQFELILSIMGYDIKNVPMNSSEPLHFLNIAMSPKSNDLPDVVLRTYIKNGWKVWGKIFLSQFIGTAPLSTECKILNPEVIHFQFKKMDSVLIAFANETILIQNKKLGYLLHYDLSEFQYDFINSRIIFQGYPLFEPLKNSETKKVINKRAEIYKGSVMHFMRSLFTNTLKENNFEIRRMVKTINLGGQDIVIDGATNYDNTKPVKYELISDKLPADSIAYGESQNTAGLFFKNYLQVTYFNKKVSNYYNRYYITNNQSSVSEITLMKKTPLFVYSNGTYYEPTNLLLSGYWSWSEKIGYLLPFDYTPPSK